MVGVTDKLDKCDGLDNFLCGLDVLIAVKPSDPKKLVIMSRRHFKVKKGEEKLLCAIPLGSCLV